MLSREQTQRSSIKISVDGQPESGQSRADLAGRSRNFGFPDAGPQIISQNAPERYSEIVQSVTAAAWPHDSQTVIWTLSTPSGDKVRPLPSNWQSSSTNPAMYPPINPYESGFFPAANSDKHKLYYEVSGNKEGDPVVFLHGGPGSGTDPEERQFFNPAKYKIVLFDQRGAGKSTPIAELEDNTTWDLVKDIEALRQKLGVVKWHVFGGSWGSTLALAYAQTHPDRVKSLVIQGILTLRQSELRFYYQDGTSHLFPEQWEEYLAPIPEGERGDLIKAYHSRLNSSDEKISVPAAKAWAKWQMATLKLIVSEDDIAQAEKDDFEAPSARVENHYFINEGFMRDGQLLEKQEIDKIRHIPTIIVQGRYDVICTATTAWELKRVWPEATLYIIPDAGHSSREPGIEKKLVEATDTMVSKGL